MPTSAFPAITDALVATFHEIFDPLGVTVLDGPEPSDDNPDQFAAVGYAGDPTEADDTAAVFDQTWAGMGANRARNEGVDIICCVCVLGQATVKAARDAAYGLFEQLGTQLRIDPFQGANAQWVEVLNGSFHPVPSPSGMGGRVVFTIHAEARI